MQKTSKLKQLAGRLLATTCLTLAASVAATAGTIVNLTEGAQETLPGTVVVVSSGQTSVNGILSLNDGKNGDFFELEGLPGGASFASIGLAIENNGPQDIDVAMYNDTPTEIFTLTDVPSLGAIDPNGTVPVDGNLIVNLIPTNEESVPYSVLMFVTPTSTPEPGTLAGMGLGLAGIAGLGLRRRAKQS